MLIGIDSSLRPVSAVPEGWATGLGTCSIRALFFIPVAFSTRGSAKVERREALDKSGLSPILILRGRAGCGVRDCG
jgi:hypothetical protein